jgi:hypothetical protein
MLVSTLVYYVERLALATEIRLECLHILSTGDEPDEPFPNIPVTAVRRLREGEDEEDFNNATHGWGECLKEDAEALVMGDYYCPADHCWTEEFSPDAAWVIHLDDLDALAKAAEWCEFVVAT